MLPKLRGKMRILGVGILALFSHAVHAQDCGTQAPQTIPNSTPCLGPYNVNMSDSKGAGFDATQYESWAYWDVHAHDYNNGLLCLPFRMLKPLNYNPASPKRYPLIVMLHGSGECGYDNNRVLYNGGGAHKNALNSGAFDGFVVFPQSPYGNWAANNPEDTSSSLQVTEQLARMFTMVDSLKQRFKIDPDRVVIHGLSAGGTGTLASLYHRPDLFAAALPMSATTSTSNFNTSTPYPNPPWTDPSVEPKVRRNMGFISPIPLWWFQGSDDVNPSPAITTPSVQFLRDSGAINTNATGYTIFQGVAHNTWGYAYAEPDFFPFIQRQNKRHLYLMGENPICCAKKTMIGFSPGFYSYQWFRNGVAILGETKNKLKNIAQGGKYHVRCIRRGSSSYYYSDTLTIINTDEGTNAPPVVSIVSPPNNTTINTPASIGLQASATDPDGTITKVEFYKGTTLLYTDATAPYSYTWSGMGTGTYSITAKATDNQGAVTTSEVVSLKVVVPNSLPTVNLTSPANNTGLVGPATINLTANASDDGGTISKVEFYSGFTLLYTDVTAPYSYAWTGVGVGTYSLTANATDNLGAVVTSTAVKVVVSAAGNQLPTTRITDPRITTYTAPANITVVAAASDPDGTVARVDFYNGTSTTEFAHDVTAPYAVAWSNVGPGTYTLTTKVTDNQGAIATSAPLTIVVNSPTNRPPSVTLTSPVNYAGYNSPAAINLAATATDPDGDQTISKVDFYNGSTLLYSDATAPYAYAWTGVAEGNYTISAVATDSQGGVASSSTVSVVVSTFVNQLPTVSITSPANNAGFATPGSFTISASAADADGNITKVDFYNGTTLLGTDGTLPYNYAWSGISDGTYSLTAKATDNMGGVTTSDPVSVIVTSTPNKYPTVSLTSPLNNANFSSPATITLTANAADEDGFVSKVNFYNGTTLLYSDATAPYSYDWAGVTPGTYSLVAKAVDNFNAVKVSATVTVVVSTTSNTAPAVSLTSPANNASFTTPATISLAATASDADGTVSKVDFYNGSTLLFSDATSPYSYSWTGVAVGTYSITAKAFDNLGAVTTSAAANVTVATPPNTLPTVSLTSPADNASFTAPATISLTATASDADGTVSKVDFYNGSTLLFSDAASPYAYSWTGVAAGSYTLTAKATDDQGGVKTSTAVSITVSGPANTPPSVSLTSPANNASFTAPATISLTATASDADGTVSKVDFYNGATLLFSDATSPYSYSWTGVAAGTYTLTAKATDNSNAVSTSTAVSVVVSASGNANPVVTITSPANNASYVAPNSFEIDASASDADGSISKVDFYLNNSLISSDSWAPYQANVWNLAIGTYTIMAKATDNQGGVGTASTQVYLTDASAFFTTSAPCFTPGGTVTFTLDPSKRTNATNYYWSFSGQGGTVNFTPGANGYTADVVASSSITSGQVCVGVTYQSGYQDFCNTMNKCANAREDDAPIAFTNLALIENGAAFQLTSDKEIAQVTVVAVTGTVEWETNDIPSNKSLEFGATLPAGLHLVQIRYTDGSADLKKVQKTR